MKKSLKKELKGKLVTGYDAYRKVEQMPRFKEDSGIYGWKSIGKLLEKALEDWKMFKNELRIYNAH